MGDVSKTTPWFRRFLALTALAVIGNLAQAQEQVDPEDSIDSLEKLQERVQEIHQASGTEAVGIAVVENGELVWLDALGQANIERQIPATPDTLFRIGSTSKMFVALAALKLAEEGKLDLNAPLRQLAPEIEFENRWEDEHPVRLVHLLEHTTGWHDMRFVEYAHNQPEPIELREALTLYPESRQSRWIPGTRMAYCNTGMGVAAYVVEKVAGVPFETYVQENFFEPLGMTSATYFQPENFEQSAAQAYLEKERQDYWHIIYRPAGSINASPRELAKLLQFFLERGQLEGKQLLPDTAIDRMEVPHTTLGNKHGITAGYGLANYSSGFKDYGVAFRGHNGGVVGAYSDFTYAPQLNSGYALVTTGSPAGVSQIADALRAYLTRDLAKPAIELQALPEAFRAVDGVYKQINPRQQRMTFLPAFFSAMRIDNDGTQLHRYPVIGGWEAPSNDYAIADNLLVDRWSGLPSIALVQDPLAGEAIQVSGDLYQETSEALVWGELLFLGAVFLLSAFATVYALLWLPFNLRRERFARASVKLALWPTLASLLLMAITLRTAFISMDFTVLAAWSELSITLFVLTSVYGLISIWSAVNFVRLRGTEIRKRIRLPVALLTLLHLAMTLYLASYGMIGLRIWTW